MGKKDKNIVKNIGKSTNHLNEDGYYSSITDSDHDEEKYKKKLKKMKKLEEKMNVAIVELQKSKNEYDELIKETKEKIEKLNKLIELTSRVHESATRFNELKEISVSVDNIDTTTLPSNDNELE